MSTVTPPTPLSLNLSVSPHSLSLAHTRRLFLSPALISVARESGPGFEEFSLSGGKLRAGTLSIKRYYTEAGEDRHDGGTRVAERAVARLALLAAEVQATKDVPGRGQNPNVGRPVGPELRREPDRGFGVCKESRSWLYFRIKWFKYPAENRLHRGGKPDPEIVDLVLFR